MGQMVHQERMVQMGLPDLRECPEHQAKMDSMERQALLGRLDRQERMEQEGLQVHRVQSARAERLERLEQQVKQELVNNCFFCNS